MYTPLGYKVAVGSHPMRGVAVIDPVCGMEVQPESAAAAWEHAGTTYYFCSIGCMERFRADPDGFLATEPSEPGL